MQNNDYKYNPKTQGGHVLNHGMYPPPENSNNDQQPKMYYFPNNVVPQKNNAWVKWVVLGVLGAIALFVILMLGVVALAPPEFWEATTTEVSNAK